MGWSRLSVPQPTWGQLTVPRAEPGGLPPQLLVPRRGLYPHPSAHLQLSSHPPPPVCPSSLPGSCGPCSPKSEAILTQFHSKPRPSPAPPPGLPFTLEMEQALQNAPLTCPCRKTAASLQVGALGLARACPVGSEQHPLSKPHAGPHRDGLPGRTSPLPEEFGENLGRIW